MKVEFKPRIHINNNDCWCDAIALATGSSYDTVFSVLIPFLEPEGYMSDHFIEGMLCKAGYTSYRVDNSEIFTIGDAMNYLNHYANHIVLFTRDHVVYVHNNTIHDTMDIEERNRFLDSRVTKYYMKMLEEK